MAPNLIYKFNWRKTWWSYCTFIDYCLLPFTLTGFINTQAKLNPIKSIDRQLHEKLPVQLTEDLHLSFGQLCLCIFFFLCSWELPDQHFTSLYLYVHVSALACALVGMQTCTAAASVGSLGARSSGEKGTTHSQPPAAQISSEECWLSPSQKQLYSPCEVVWNSSWVNPPSLGGTWLDWR